jgi:DNA-binding NarL/FixJ family response regulator
VERYRREESSRGNSGLNAGAPQFRMEPEKRALQGISTASHFRSGSTSIPDVQKLPAICKASVNEFPRESRYGALAPSTVCVISSSPLAGQFLVQLLCRNPEFNPILADAFFPRAHQFPHPTFVLDCTCLPLPLCECLRRLNKRFGDARYVVIDDMQTEDEVVSKVALGIHGLVEYANVRNVLKTAVRAVAKGGLYIPEEVLETYVKSCALPKRPRSPVGIASTTPREREVLELVKSRLSNKEIAGILGVQESTVKFHIANILGKLSLQSRYELSRGKREPWEEMLA